MAKGMITSAIVVSKVSVTKICKPRCLCYWLVDSPYLENWLKTYKKKISFWRSN